MSEEKEGQVQPGGSDEPMSEKGNEIEDELSPIDTMEFLSRAGRSQGATDRAAETPPPSSPPDEEESETPDVAEVVEPTPVPEPEPPEETADYETPVPSPEPEGEDFDSLLTEYLDRIHDFSAGDIIDAVIVDVKRDYVLVDVGDKAEGVIAIDEFVDDQGEINVSVGDTISVQILGRDSDTGQVQVSYRQAAQELAWQRIKDSVKQGAPVSGTVTGAVRAGVLVDIGVSAFMPASQIDASRVDNLDEWVGREVSAYIIDVDRQRRRVVLSRRKLVEEDQERNRKRILESLQPGEKRVVRIKKILDFGAFADLGGLDGLIPREEVSWERGSHPNDYLKEGRDLKVIVLSVDVDKGRVALSRKRVKPDPWEKIGEKYPDGEIVKGKVVGLADFGAFVSLEEGVRGMIHSSDLSWAAGRQKAKDFLHVGDTVKAVVLETDAERRRMALGLKQISMDPWIEVEGKFQPGTVVKGTITSITNYGAFLKIDENVEGLIHVSDMTWDAKTKAPSEYVKEGQEVEAVVLKTERDRRRISLGVKQMSKSPIERFAEQNKTGSYVRGKITRLAPFGVFVEVAPGIEGLCHISQLDTERIEKPEDAVKVGDTIDAKLTKLDKKTGKISLSRKDYLKEQESREVEQYVNQSLSGGVNMGELLKGLKIETPEGENSQE